MNIADAKQIDLRRLAEQFGGRFSHQSKPDELWLYSPFRPDERTASFKINPLKNLWYDFARGAGGSTIDLWLDYYNQNRRSSAAIKDALQGLQQFAINKSTTLQQYKASGKDCIRGNKPAERQQTRFQLIKPPGGIRHGALLEEIGRRRLSLATVIPFLKQADIRDTKTGNKLTGFAFQNDAFGWEISIPNPNAGKSFKTSIGKKALTSFQKDKHEKALIFEGFWDYLTWIQMEKIKNLEALIFVLNSLSFKTSVIENLVSIKNVSSIFLFLDNDVSGRDAEDYMITELQERNLIVGTKNHIYKNHKDLSDYWMRKI